MHREASRRKRPPGHRKRAHFTTFHVRKLFQTIGFLKIVDVTIIGREHIPKKGGKLIVPNHISMLDIIFVWTALRGTAVAIGAAEMFKLWYAGWLGRLLGFIKYVRKQKDGNNAAESAESGAKAFEMMADVLNDNGTGIIFGEGHIVPPGEELHEFQAGPARLAFLTGAALVPCYIHGANDVMPLSRYRQGKKIFHLKHKVYEIFGPPLYAKDYSSVEDMTTALRQAIIALRENELPKVA